MLIIIIAISCRTYSTASIISTADTIPERIAISDSVTLETVQKTLPAGFYVLSERGARRSIKASIDAEAFFQKWKLTDDALGKMAVTVSVVTMERNAARESNAGKDAIIQDFTRRLKWEKVWKYAAIGAAAALVIKSL